MEPSIRLQSDVLRRRVRIDLMRWANLLAAAMHYWPRPWQPAGVGGRGACYLSADLTQIGEADCAALGASLHALADALAAGTLGEFADARVALGPFLGRTPPEQSATLAPFAGLTAEKPTDLHDLADFLGAGGPITLLPGHAGAGMIRGFVIEPTGLRRIG